MTHMANKVGAENSRCAFGLLSSRSFKFPFVAETRLPAVSDLCRWPSMRAYFLIFSVLACAQAFGCSRSGNFSTFIVAEVAKHGGHTVTNAPSLPTLEARWTIQSDTNGFQAHVTGAPFSSIDAVMTQAFGAPKVSVASNASGQPHRVWAALDIGVAIQLIGRPDGAEIVCVRGMRDTEDMFESMEKRP